MSTTDYSDGIVHGNPPGGVTIMWDVKPDRCVRPLDLNLDWCVLITITVGSKTFSIFNVYMPYQCHDNEPMYVEKLGILKAITRQRYAIIGDWNANLYDIDN